MIKSIQAIKDKLKVIAKEKNMEFNTVMRFYMYDRFIERLSRSKYKNNFILKGGLLLSAIFGDERRTTQDMDTMIKGLPLDTKELENIIYEIINIDGEDNISFKIKNTKEIRLIDKYGGLKISLIGFKEHLQVPLSIDITVGDPITPRELEFKYKCMFDDSYISIMAFNKETIIAEKFETFITDNIMNTRAKDFNDLYILLTRFYDELNKDTLVKAIKNTFKRRETNLDIEKIVKTFNLIKESDKLRQNFKNYRNKKSYVENIDYDAVMDSINLVIKLLEQELVGV